MTALRTADSGIALLNADCGSGMPTSVRVVQSRIVGLGADPQPGDRIIDLQGDRLLPGLINAHDHLQLNSFPRCKYRGQYRNVSEWIADVGSHRQTDELLRSCEAVPRDTRLLIGGLKNLLSGVTTVAHHDPLYPSLVEPGFPVRVVEAYGWSHSLQLDGSSGVANAYRKTPGHWPWIIHAAEGTDDEAASEFETLEALGCVAANTLIVHGIALATAQQQRLSGAGAGLIWCPSSNLHLFDRTAAVAELASQQRVTLGSDSRLSGARDLLEELGSASDTGQVDERALEAMVGGTAARLLRLTDRGVLAAGTLADLLILPRALPLSRATRADVRMVMVGGAMRYGDLAYAWRLAPPADWADVIVDGRVKSLAPGLAERLRKSPAYEPGVELADRQWRRA